MEEFYLSKKEEEIITGKLVSIPMIKREKKSDLQKYMLKDGAAESFMKFYKNKDKIKISINDLAVIMLNTFREYIEDGSYYGAGLQFVLNFIETFLNEKDPTKDADIEKEISYLYREIQNKYKKFCNPNTDDKTYVYAIDFYDFDDYLFNLSTDYFPTVERAYNYGKYILKEEILKYFTISKVECTNIKLFLEYLEENAGFDIKDDEIEHIINYDPDCDKCVTFEFYGKYTKETKYKKKELKDVLISDPDISFYDEIYYNISSPVKDRFVNIPHPFTNGKIVYDITKFNSDDGKIPVYGVINDFDSEGDLIRWFSNSYEKNLKEEFLNYYDSYVDCLFIGYLDERQKFHFQLRNSIVKLNPFFLNILKRDTENKIKTKVIGELLHKLKED